MVTTDQFLRRSLFAPIAVPALVAIAFNSQKPFGEDTSGILVCFLVASVIAFIPYLWMLCEKRRVLTTLSGERLEKEIILLPLAMIKYAFLTNLVLLIGSFLVSMLLSGGRSNGFGAFDWLFPLFATLIAVPIVGYAFVIVTYTWLGLFKLLRLID